MSVYIWSELWWTWQRGVNPGGLSVYVQDGPVGRAVNDCPHRVAVPVSHSDIVEIDEGAESRVDPIRPIGQPDRLSGTPEVDAKVAYPVADPFPNDVAVVSRHLAHCRKDGEVGHQWRVEGRWKGDDRLAIEPHGLPLEKDDFPWYDSSRVVKEVLAGIGHWAATEVASGAISVAGASCGR